MRLFNLPTIYRNADAGAGAGGGSGDAGAGAGAGAAAGAGAGAGGDAGAGGGQPPASWYAQFNLDEPSRNFIADRKFDGEGGLAQLVKSSIESDRMARSRNVIERPDPAKPRTDWQGWEQLGWKPKLEEYTLKKPQTPDGFEYMQSFEDTIRKIGHEQRVPLEATQAFLDGVMKFAVAEVDAVDASGARANAALDATLRKEWGGDYDRNRELSRRASAFVGVSMDEHSAIEKAMGAARTMQLFNKLGGMIGEDRIVTGDGGGPMPESLDALNAELRRLHADEGFKKAFHNQRDPRHADVVAQRRAIIEKIARIETAGQRGQR